MDSNSPATPAKSTAETSQFLLSTVLILSLSLGFLDTTLAILAYPFSELHWAMVVLPTATTVFILFILYFLLWLTAGRLFLLVSNMEKRPLAISFAFFISVFFLLSLITNLQHRP